MLFKDFEHRLATPKIEVPTLFQPSKQRVRQYWNDKFHLLNLNENMQAKDGCNSALPEELAEDNDLEFEG